MIFMWNLFNVKWMFDFIYNVVYIVVINWYIMFLKENLKSDLKNVFVKYSFINLFLIIDEVYWIFIICIINEIYNDKIVFYLLMRVILMK